jgi:hypothetical protein
MDADFTKSSELNYGDNTFRLYGLLLNLPKITLTNEHVVEKLGAEIFP